MSSMLWAAAAASVSAQVTAEQMIENAKSHYAIDEPRSVACPETDGSEIVVCLEIRNPERYRVPSDTDRGVVKHDVPRAPDVSGLPDCSTATFCSRVGGRPRQVKLIDLDKIPEAPPGSDADRIGRGELADP